MKTIGPAAESRRMLLPAFVGDILFYASRTLGVHETHCQEDFCPTVPFRALWPVFTDKIRRSCAQSRMGQPWAATLSAPLQPRFNFYRAHGICRAPQPQPGPRLAPALNRFTSAPACLLPHPGGLRVLAHAPGWPRVQVRPVVARMPLQHQRRRSAQPRKLRVQRRHQPRR